MNLYFKASTILLVVLCFNFSAKAIQRNVSNLEILSKQLSSAPSLPTYNNENSWQLLSVNSGVTRYAWDWPNQSAKPLITDNKAYFIGGNRINNGVSAQNTVLSLDLITGEINTEAQLGNSYLRENSSVLYSGRIFSVGGGIMLSTMRSIM
ncbi:hypothetical protein [Pseudoalteromonas lipolytica]